MSKACSYQRPNCIPMTTSEELRLGKEGGPPPPPFGPLAKTLHTQFEHYKLYSTYKEQYTRLISTISVSLPVPSRKPGSSCIATPTLWAADSLDKSM